jgi:hypothetical protein
MENNILHQWENVVDHGFGDRRNMCAWSIASYKDYLYIGTFNVKHGCKVYRSKSGDKHTWNQVNSTGFDNTNPSTGARTMKVFKDLLWVVTFSKAHGTQVWITNGELEGKQDFITWKKANINGFGQGTNVPGSRAMAVYNDKLYIGSQSRTGIPQIYRYDGPVEFENIDPTNWTWVNKEWGKKFGGHEGFFLIGSLLPFKSSTNKEYLYAGIYSEFAHLVGKLINQFRLSVILQMLTFFLRLRCKIWRYDGNKWEEIISNGFGKPNLMTLSALNKNALYFGTTNVFGSELWKSNDGLKWNRIIKRGIGNPLNLSIWGLGYYENKILIGMQNLFQGGQIWASTTENPESNRDFRRISPYAMEGVKQFNMLKITQDGIKNFEYFNGYVYAPTSSYMNILRSNVLGPGCQVWRRKQI